MAYDAKLADRIREALASKRGVTEREMFGGIGFLLGGKFVAGVHRNELMVRVPVAEHDALAKQKGARTFEMTGRPPMKGWMLVDPATVKTGPALAKWIDRSAAAIAKLPAKNPKKKPPAKTRRG
jgi:TfoX/Sxy family transcriptional regulator of competence genes